MKILGIDYGKRNIGLAISDEKEIIAAKLQSLKIKHPEELLEKLKELRKSQNFEQILLGIPQKGEITEIVKCISEKIEMELNINVILWPEDYSSQKAESGKSRKFKKEKSHSEAARIILQEYLNNKLDTKG